MCGRPLSPVMFLFFLSLFLLSRSHQKYLLMIEREAGGCLLSSLKMGSQTHHRLPPLTPMTSLCASTCLKKEERTIFVLQFLREYLFNFLAFFFRGELYTKLYMCPSHVFTRKKRYIRLVCFYCQMCSWMSYYHHRVSFGTWWRVWITLTCSGREVKEVFVSQKAVTGC